MLGLLLTLVCFSGFVLAVHSVLKIKLAYSPLVSISFIGIALYIFALSGYLKQGAIGLLFVGLAFALYFGSLIYKQPAREKTAVKFFFTMFAIFSIISFILTLNMAFTVIDDYVYWGIIGKYLYLYDHLPVTGNPLDTRILAYTPGTALIHYFFYVLPGKYSVDISYFAQAIILICSLCVVLDTENIKKSIGYIGLLSLLMTIFAGSVFTKLQVDYLLSILCFSIFWIYCNEKDMALRHLILFMPICFLFLIKEIGFALGLFILVMMLVDVLADNGLKNKKRPISLILMTGLGMLLLKKMWVSHVTAMGFYEFHSAVNWESIQKTLFIFSDQKVQKAALIFVKDIFLGSADRLNLPYVIWYILIGFTGYKIFKTIEKENTTRFVLFSGMVLLVFLIYLFLLYGMQVIIFGLGSSSDQTLGFSRYLNIVFSPIVFIAVLVFFQRLFFRTRQISQKVCISIIVVVVLVLGASRLEVYLHREKQDIHIQKVSQQIAGKIEQGVHSIGVITNKTDNLANLQFLFYLLPNKVDYLPRAFEDQASLMAYALGQDYIICYKPAQQIFDWLKPFLEDQTDLSEVTVLRVYKDKSRSDSNISLERIPL